MMMKQQALGHRYDSILFYFSHGCVAVTNSGQIVVHAHNQMYVTYVNQRIG